MSSEQAATAGDSRRRRAQGGKGREEDKGTQHACGAHGEQAACVATGHVHSSHAGYLFGQSSLGPLLCSSACSNYELGGVMVSA